MVGEEGKGWQFVQFFGKASFVRNPWLSFSCFAQSFIYEPNDGVSPEHVETSIPVGTRFEQVRVRARLAQAPVRASLTQFDQVPLRSTEKNINYFATTVCPRALSQSLSIFLNMHFTPDL